MEMVERLGNRGQLAEHGGNGEPRITALADDASDVRAVDPVHDEHVTVVEEEVVPHHRQRRVRLELQEGATLGQQLIPPFLGPDAPHLQGHEAVVLAVDGLHDLAIVSLPEHLEQLVTLCNEPCHAGIVGAGLH